MKKTAHLFLMLVCSILTLFTTVDSKAKVVTSNYLMEDLVNLLPQETTITFNANITTQTAIITKEGNQVLHRNDLINQYKEQSTFIIQKNSYLDSDYYQFQINKKDSKIQINKIKSDTKYLISKFSYKCPIIEKSWPSYKEINYSYLVKISNGINFPPNLKNTTNK